MKIKLNLVKIKNSLKLFWAKIKTNVASAYLAVVKLVKRVNWQKLRFPAIVILILIGIAEIVFGVLIYGFRMDNKVVRVAAQVVPYPVAVVNFETISYYDYLKEKDYIHHFYTATQQADVNFKEIDSEIIDQLIENKIIKYQALRYGVKVDKKEVDTTISSIVEQNGGNEKVSEVLNELYGLNLDQFKRLVKLQLLRDQINNEKIVKISASHILIRVDKDAPEEKVVEGKTKIEGILNEIKAGLDFGEAAKKHSEDIGSAEQGGKLEPFAKGEMVDEFSDAAFATKAGELSAPVRSEFGWHIIKVEGRTGTIEKKFNDWIEEIKKKSVIVKLYEI